jgi:hypothetical protein
VRLKLFHELFSFVIRNGISITDNKKKPLESKAFIDLIMERVMGIEPTLLAWKVKVLPLNYTRSRYGRDDTI